MVSTQVPIQGELFQEFCSLLLRDGGSSRPEEAPSRCSFGAIMECSPSATASASGEAEKDVTKRIIPTILIVQGGLIFIDGGRNAPEDIPTWLGHDVMDILDEEIEKTGTVLNTPESSWKELRFSEDKTVGIEYPLGTVKCTPCNKAFLNHTSLDSHLQTAHNDTFRHYTCAKCPKTYPRYKQAAIHYSKCRATPGNRGKVVREATSNTQTGECGDSPLTQQDREPGQNTGSTGHTCTECNKTFRSRSGLSQHDRHHHPNRCNERRIATRLNDIERKRLARSKANAAKASQSDAATVKASKLWSEEEIELLVALEVELKHARFINKAIAERMPGKTNKQISDKRRQLTSARSKEQRSIDKSCAPTTPPQEPIQNQATPVPDTQPRVTLAERFKGCVLTGTGNTMELSSKVLNRAIEGEGYEDLQSELIAQLIKACSVPEKSGNNAPKAPPKEQTRKKNSSQRKVDEFRRIQMLFDKNRKQLVSELLDGKGAAAKCELDPKVVYETYSERFGGESQEVDLSKYPKASPADNVRLLGPISQEEVAKAMARAKKDSASGPDGIGLKDLKTLDPKLAMTTNIYNVWLYTGKIPDKIKENRSILLPKGSSGLDNVNNWRPLTISSVLLRLYTNILAKRVLKAVPLNPRQRGFIEAPGCTENQLLWQRIRRYAIKHRKPLSMVLLDLAKAFDTVSHKHIVAALERFAIDEHFIDVVVDLYTNAGTHFTLPQGDTEEIKMTRGVKQGDPLSPLLFNIAMDPLLEELSQKRNGFKWDSSGLQLEALCYADDNGLLTESTEAMQNNLEAVQNFCEATGMRLNVKKSAGFAMKPGAKDSYIINDFSPQWTVDGQNLPLIDPADGTRYLGVNISNWTGAVKEDLVGKLETWCKRICDAPLKPRQKVIILNQYAIGRLQFYMSQVDLPQNKLKEMDVVIRRYVRKWLKLPECATDHILYAGSEKGGLSLPRLSLSVPCSRINVKRAALNSNDESIRAFVKADGIEAEIAQAAASLSIKVPANPKVSAKWRHNEERRWRGLPLAGKGLKAFSYKCANSWMALDGGYFRESDFIAGMQVRTDTYPTRVALARAGGTGETQCRRCKTSPETVGHISGHCPFMKGYRINRHNGVCKILSERMTLNGWTVSSEPRLQCANGNTLIPDLVGVKGKRAVLIDPTIVYENDDRSLQKANSVKIAKYKPLIDTIKTTFGVEKVELFGLAIGARGGWCAQNTRTLESIGLKDKGLHALLCRFALRGTLNMLRLFTDHQAYSRPKA